MLQVLERLPYAAIAALTGDSENASKARVHRARALMKKQLGDQVDQPFKPQP